MQDGPAGYPLLGHLPPFLHDKLGFLLKCASTNACVVKLKIGTLTFLLNDPEDIKHVLVTNHLNYDKSPRITSKRGKRLFGEGLITSSGSAHLQKRHVLQPIFHRRVMADFADVMVGSAEQMLSGWEDGAEIDIALEMMGLTQRIMIKSLLGIDCREEAKGLCGAISVRRRYVEYMFRSLFPFPEYLPTRINYEYRRAARRLDNIIYGMIRAQRGAAAPANHMLAMLLKARHEDGTLMSDREIYDEVLTLSIAGYETIGEALAWAWYLLSQHPAEEALLLTELHETLDGRAPGVADLPKLRYTAMVFYEAMRLYPPTWLFVRIAKQDDELPSGVKIPADSKLFLSPYAAHRNPRYFPNPEEFHPERFTDISKRTRPRFAYFPFGGGPRVCIGEAFGTMEGVLLLACVAQRYKFSLIPGQKIVPEPGVTLRPREGIRMRLIQRQL